MKTNELCEHVRIETGLSFGLTDFLHPWIEFNELLPQEHAGRLTFLIDFTRTKADIQESSVVNKDEEQHLSGYFWPLRIDEAQDGSECDYSSNMIALDNALRSM